MKFKLGVRAIGNHPKSRSLCGIIGFFRGDYIEDGYRTGGIAAAESSGFRVAHETAAETLHSDQLYAFGPVTQYWQNQNNYTAAFVNAAKGVAQEWAAFAAAGSNVFHQGR